VARGDTDIVLVAREMLEDPNWALHARRALADDEFAHWHVEASGALQARRHILQKLADAGETPLDRFAGA
jgi:2,4-dienoyl-CoA reductase-like NADH-dependent reductase (Old Yellow Enzyme family)